MWFGMILSRLALIESIVEGQSSGKGNIHIMAPYISPTSQHDLLFPQDCLLERLLSSSFLFLLACLFLLSGSPFPTPVSLSSL